MTNRDNNSGVKHTKLVAEAVGDVMPRLRRHCDRPMELGPGPRCGSLTHLIEDSWMVQLASLFGLLFCSIPILPYDRRL